VLVRDGPPLIDPRMAEPLGSSDVKRVGEDFFGLPISVFDHGADSGQERSPQGLVCVQYIFRVD